METISNFERGKSLPSIITLTQLSEELGISLARFFEFESDADEPAAVAAVSARLRLVSDDDQKLAMEFLDLLVRRSSGSGG